MSDEVKYGVFSWGPCIVQLKISEDFRKKLLSEAEESRKEELKFTTKLAGVIKEEYAYRQKEIFLPEVSQVLGVYDQAFQKFKNKPYEQKPEYLLNSLWVNFMKKNEFNHSGECILIYSFISITLFFFCLVGISSNTSRVSKLT